MELPAKTVPQKVSLPCPAPSPRRTLGLCQGPNPMQYPGRLLSRTPDPSPFLCSMSSHLSPRTRLSIPFHSPWPQRDKTTHRDHWLGQRRVGCQLCGKRLLIHRHAGQARAVADFEPSDDRYLPCCALEESRSMGKDPSCGLANQPGSLQRLQQPDDQTSRRAKGAGAGSFIGETRKV